MTGNTLISKWSDVLLDKLLEYREANPDFTFAVRQVNRSQRLDKGYWFQGDETYIFVGFTARGDESNKTRSVGLVFSLIEKSKARCWVEVVFKTEPMKKLEKLYRDFIIADGQFQSDETPYYKDFKYYKHYGIDNPLKHLERFLETDWAKLSTEVKSRGLDNVFFVPEADFLLYVNRIQQQRNKPLLNQKVKDLTIEYGIPITVRSSETAQLDVPVLLSDQEYSLLLTEGKENLTGQWRGEVEDFTPTTWAQFTEVNGAVTNLQLSPQLMSLRDILYERISDALRQLRESELEGIEPTDDTPSDEDRGKILDPYNPDEIKMRTAQFPVFQIFDMIKKGDVDLNPDFQRHLVWDMKRKSRLIESTLLGIPLPVFYFSQDKDGVFHVVDGLQRLTTIRDFMNNKFYLRNLEHLTICDGRFYISDDNIKENKALERRFQRRLEQTQLSVNIIESSSPPKVKYDIFRRINEGGKPLNQQEIRNSLAKKSTRDLLRNMVLSEEFIRATGGNAEKDEHGISDQRMGAQEMVLRFIGFYFVRQGALTYLGDMNNFLDDTLDRLNGVSEKELEVIGKKFRQAMRNCYHLFGQYCFRKCLSIHLEPNAPRQLINKSLFTTWSVVVGELPGERINKQPFEAFARLLAKELDKKDEYYTVVTLRTNDRRYLERAFEITAQLITENL